MADSNIQLSTDGAGKKIDTRTEGTNSEHRQVMVIGDPATNAGVAPVDATKGLAVDLSATGANSNKLLVTPDLPTGASTSTKQSDGSQKSQVVDGSGNVIGATSNALDVNIKSATTIATTHTDTAPATQAITAVDAVTSTATGANSQSIFTGSPTANSAASFTIAGVDTVAIQVTGTWVATLTIEVSFDGGTTWYTRGLHQFGTNYVASTFTANFAGNLSAADFTNVRVRSTAYTSGTATVRLAGSLNPSTVYIANTPGLADGTTPSQKLAIDSTGAASVNQAKVSGTAVDVNNGTVSSGTQRVTLASDSTGQVKSTNFPTTVDTNNGTVSASTPRVTIASDSTGQIKATNLPTTVDTNAGAVGASTIRVVQGAKTITTTSSTAASSGNNTIQAAGTNKLKVFAFSLSTTSTTAVTCIFQSGASGTELWRVTLQAISGGNVGANLAVSLPTYLFATASATLLNLNLSSANTVHYSVSFIDEA